MTSANCPTCGGPIEFKIGSSFLVVCPHCKSAIARTDRELKDLGKVAALVDTDSPLAVGLSGKYFNVSFRLTGRAQLRHTLGGVWDEWYAAFSDGRWGWLAEAQGRFFMTFEAPLKDPPDYDSLIVGEPAPKMPVPLVVAEKGSATYESAEGEIPFPLRPGDECDYVDLNGENGLFATLDYSEAFAVFYPGREVTLQELALDAGGALLKPEKRAPVLSLGCPNCGGSLDLRAPDETERVGCPYCGALLDCTQGKFSLLQALSGKLEKPLLPLGSEAEFEGARQTVIGFMRRSCLVEGVRYFWTEYLLHSKQHGFRWLVHSDDHWTYVKSIPTAEVKPSGKHMFYKGRRFDRFQDAPARVEFVLGEFYWKVSIGETVAASDFICPPRMLSSERMSYDGGGGEIAWSLGEYVYPAEIQKKFKLAALKRPAKVGACEPNRFEGWGKPWLLMTAASIVLAILFGIAKPGHAVFSKGIALEPLSPQIPQADPAAALAASESGQVYFSEEFELHARELVDIEAVTTLNNSWLALECDLINKETGEVQPFDINVEYYQGVEGGESWSEGNQTNYAYLSALPAGKYELRIEAHWEHPQQPIAFHINISQSGTRGLHWFMLFLGISIMPACYMVRRYLFHSQRWSESMYGQ